MHKDFSINLRSNLFLSMVIIMISVFVQYTESQPVQHDYTVKSCYGGTNANLGCTSNADCLGGVCLDPVVAWWSLDEANGIRIATGGSCGIDCDLTDVNGVGQDTVNFTEGSAAAGFNASNDEYLRCTNANCEELGVTGGATFGCWVRPTYDTGTMQIMNRLTGNSGYRINRLVSDVVQMTIGDGTDSVTIYSAANSFPVNIFTHIVGTADATNDNIQTWINGEASGTPGTQQDMGNASTTFYLSYALNTQDFDGQMDECFVSDELYTSNQICEICRFGLDGQESDRGAICGNCDYTTVIPPDTTPPARSNENPTGTLPNGITQTTISLDTDENAVCRYSTTSGTSYGSMINAFSTTGGTSHSQPITGLTDGTSYDYYVRCNDTVGNVNTGDFVISFSVASGPSAGSVYYVDPSPAGCGGSGCSATNAGTSRDVAWPVLPGTRASDDSIWLYDCFGSGCPITPTISTSQKVQPGDVIYVRPGATQANVPIDICNTGGRCNGREGFYADADRNNPIKIIVDSNWPNTSGSFTIDCSTQSADFAGEARACVNLRISGLQIHGIDANQRFIVNNCDWGQYALVAVDGGWYGTYGYIDDILLNQVDIDGTQNDANCHGIVFDFVKDSLIINSRIYGATGFGGDGGYGVSLGWHNDHRDETMMFYNVEIDNNEDAGATIDNCRDCKFVRVKAHDNGIPGAWDGRGLNPGGIEGQGHSSFAVLESELWGNLEWQFGGSGCGYSEGTCGWPGFEFCDENSDCPGGSCSYCAQQQQHIVAYNILHDETSSNSVGGGSYCYGGAHCRYYRNTVIGGHAGSEGHLKFWSDSNPELVTADWPTPTPKQVAIGDTTGRYAGDWTKRCSTNADCMWRPGTTITCNTGNGLCECSSDIDCGDYLCHPFYKTCIAPTTFEANSNIFYVYSGRGIWCASQASPDPYISNDWELMDSDRNIWVPGSGDDTEQWTTFTNSGVMGGCQNPNGEDYDNAVNVDWDGPNDLIGAQNPDNTPVWINANLTNYSENKADYVLQTSSSGYDSGDWWCKTTNSGTNSVGPILLNCDPSQHWYVASDYPAGGDGNGPGGSILLPTDVAYIGIGSGTMCKISDIREIDGMTVKRQKPTYTLGRAGSLICENSLSWDIGDGVSRIVIYGSAPDIGAFEFQSGPMTYWIDDDGTDAFTCGDQQSNPCQTYEYWYSSGCGGSGCGSLINPGDTIYFRSGTYNGDGNGHMGIPFDGTVSDPVTVACYDAPGSCIIDGTGLPVADYCGMVCIGCVANPSTCQKDSASYVHFKGFKLQNAPVSGSAGMYTLVITDSATNHILVQDNNLDGTGTNRNLVHVTTGPNFITFLNNTLTNCVPDGGSQCIRFDNGLNDAVIGNDFGPVRQTGNTDCVGMGSSQNMLLDGNTCHDALDGFDAGMSGSTKLERTIRRYNEVKGWKVNGGGTSRAFPTSGDSSTLTTTGTNTVYKNVAHINNAGEGALCFENYEYTKSIYWWQNTCLSNGGYRSVFATQTKVDGTGVQDIHASFNLFDSISSLSTTYIVVDNGAGTVYACPESSPCPFFKNGLWFAERGAGACIEWAQSDAPYTSYTCDQFGTTFNTEQAEHDQNFRSDPNFVDRSNPGTLSNLQLTSASTNYIDQADAFCHAASAGSGNSISVTCYNTISPIYYFPQPSDYYALANDDCKDKGTRTADATNPGCFDIQIEGCGIREVTSITGSTITFSGASCSWNANAMVHVPWSGSAPDIGALEFQSSPGPPSSNLPPGWAFNGSGNANIINGNPQSGTTHSGSRAANVTNTTGEVFINKTLSYIPKSNRIYLFRVYYKCNAGSARIFIGDSTRNDDRLFSCTGSWEKARLFVHSPSSLEIRLYGGEQGILYDDLKVIELYE